MVLLELAAPAAGAGDEEDIEPVEAGAVVDEADELAAASGALVASEDVAGAGAGAAGAGVALDEVDEDAGGVAVVVVVEDFSLHADTASTNAAARSTVLFMWRIPVEW